MNWFVDTWTRLDIFEQWLLLTCLLIIVMGLLTIGGMLAFKPKFPAQATPWPVPAEGRMIRLSPEVPIMELIRVLRDTNLILEPDHISQHLVLRRKGKPK